MSTAGMRHTAKWWAERVGELAATGDARGIARRHGVKECTLKWWRWLLRAGVTRTKLHNSTPTRKAITVYDLRATGITGLAIRGDEPLRMMRRAGHRNFATTQGYIRAALPFATVSATSFRPCRAPSLRRRGFCPSLALARSKNANSSTNPAERAGFEPAGFAS